MVSHWQKINLPATHHGGCLNQQYCTCNRQKKRAPKPVRGRGSTTTNARLCRNANVQKV